MALLCLDERGQATSGAFAKLAFSQFIGESFKVRNPVNRKILKLRIGRIQMERSLTQQAAAYWFSQFEMVDAKQLERFLDFGDEASFELDSLRRDSVVDTQTLRIEDEADHAAGNQKKQA